NDGTIQTTGTGADGANVAGDGAVFTNNGTVSTLLDDSDGVSVTGTGAVVENNAAITTEGANAAAVRLAGEGAAAINNAELTTLGADGDAVVSEGTAAVITNTGTIATVGEDADGIVSLGQGAAILNDNLIATEGVGGAGIVSEGADAAITNAQAITTTGDFADGIRALGADNDIVNDGDILVLGTGSRAVVFGDEDGTLVNNGLLQADGEDSFAVFGGEGDHTVTLSHGSTLLGAFDLGGGFDTVNLETKAPGPSQFFTFGGVEEVNVLGDADVIVVQDGDDSLVQIIDLTGPSVLNEANHAVVSSVHRAILGRDRARAAAAGADTEEAGKAAVGTPVTAWGTAFGELRERGDDGNALAFDHQYAGLVGGYERNYGSYVLGVTAGFALGNIETEINSFESDVQTFFGGVYGVVPLGRFNVTGSLLAGFERFENERQVFDNVDGQLTATSDVNNTFVSASVTADTEVDLGAGVSLRPSASANYTVSFFGDSAESGAGGANLDFDSRTAHTFGTRAQLAAGYDTGPVDLEVRAGVDGRFSSEGDIDGNLAGQPFALGVSDSNSNVSGFVGASATLTEFDRFRVGADVEYRHGQREERGIAAGLRLSIDF
ncbi:MAG: autotransporter domain-containing protein, partial [Pseudomonadota bacterium]